jgi:ABC-type uncharacterized transport system permease subunit
VNKKFKESEGLSIFSALILLLVTILSANISCGFAETVKVKIVSSLPRTGSANAQTSTIVNGIRLALEEVGNSIRRS